MNPAVFTWMVYACWIFMVVYLTIAAVGVKAETQQHLAQSFGLLLAIIVSFLLPRLRIFRFVNFAPAPPVVGGFGVLLCLSGSVLLVWARRHLGRNWSGTVALKREPELVASGPYRYLRHPMYTGGLIAAIGSAIVCGGAWIFLLLSLGAIFLWRVGAEDNLMTRQFPGRYPEYKRRTWALIPFVW